jgi:hypothetical protein
MTRIEELEKIIAAAHGDTALFCAFVALRQTENGGPGREFGVLSTSAPSYDDQLRVTKNSFVNHEHRVAQGVYGPITARDVATGLFTEDFLRAFSHKWAPIGVENDPHNLNANHVKNLITSYATASGKLLAAMRQIM